MPSSGVSPTKPRHILAPARAAPILQSIIAAERAYAEISGGSWQGTDIHPPKEHTGRTILHSKIFSELVSFLSKITAQDPGMKTALDLCCPLL